jgi:hypothetical protein
MQYFSFSYISHLENMKSKVYNSWINELNLIRYWSGIIYDSVWLDLLERNVLLNLSKRGSDILS